MPEFPIAIKDADGDTIEITVSTSGLVAIRTTPLGVELDATQRDEFAQAWIAACHEADRQAGGGAAPAPSGAGTDPVCGAREPRDDPERGYDCTALPGHEPLDHAAWNPADGTLYARWPAAGVVASDG